MNRHRVPSAPLCLLALLASGHARAQDGATATTAAPAVTIYRCSDSQGRLVALRDSPCRDGEREEAVRMQRPQDPPPRAAAAPAPAPAQVVEREVRIVTVRPPQPMFECTAPDGSTYVSETGQGDARWVPQWGVVPAWPPRPLPPVRPPRPPPSVPIVRPPLPGPGPRPPGVVVPAGGTWVNDPCVRLPQDEACRRLSDRRFEILRIYHAAMPSGRAELDREQRVIDARMATDCPGF